MRDTATVLALMVLGVSASNAACLDGRDPLLLTYRYPTLREDAVESLGVVIGTVVKTNTLPDPPDPADPEGVEDYVYTIKLEETLKGSLPDQFDVREGNGTSSYRMDIGEKHLLFVEKVSGDLYVDPCGNSELLENAAKKIELLRGGRFAALPLSAEDAERKQRSEQVMIATTVHGRLRYFNGSPTARIWIVGENHMLGIRDADPGVNMPRELSDLMSFDRDVFADFVVEPLTEFKPGVMRIVRIVSAAKVVVTENEKIVFMKDKL